jgi:hypothetical protein
MGNDSCFPTSSFFPFCEFNHKKLTVMFSATNFGSEFAIRKAGKEEEIWRAFEKRNGVAFLRDVVVGSRLINRDLA